MSTQTHISRLIMGYSMFGIGLAFGIGYAASAFNIGSHYGFFTASTLLAFVGVFVVLRTPWPRLEGGEA